MQSGASYKHESWTLKLSLQWNSTQKDSLINFIASSLEGNSCATTVFLILCKQSSNSSYLQNKNTVDYSVLLKDYALHIF